MCDILMTWHYNVCVLGSCQDKLQTMFYMYDTDGSGVMSKTAIGQMFR